MFAKFQLLFMVEHSLLLMPMIWLRVCIQRRSAFLETGPFKEVSTELLSTYNVNLLLIIGGVATISVPLLQAALAYAYFRFGHPWARVLRAQVLSCPDGKSKSSEPRLDVPIEQSQDEEESKSKGLISPEPESEDKMDSEAKDDNQDIPSHLEEPEENKEEGAGKS